MGTYAWNILYSKILPAKSRGAPGAADRLPRPRPVRPYTGIWLRALNRFLVKGMFSDSNNIFLWYESEAINKKAYFQNFS